MNRLIQFEYKKISLGNILQKMSIKNISLVTMLAVTPLTLAQSQEPDLNFGSEEQDVNEFVSIERLKLVEINLSNGNTIKFSTVGTEFQLLESGITGENEISVLEQIEGNPLDKYLLLTDENTPIPKALIDLYLLEESYTGQEIELNHEGVDKSWVNSEVINMKISSDNQIEAREKLMKNREIVDELEQSIYIELESPRFKSLNLANKGSAGQGSCNNNTGYLYFEDNHCGINGSKGKGNTESACDNPMHNSINRHSNTGKRVTYTRAVYCGTDNAYINHYTYYSQWNQGWVKLGPTIFLDPYSWKHLETWAGKYSLPRKRRAYVNRLSNNGYVRAWNRFYRKVK